MDFSQIQELIRMVGKHKISEFMLKEGDFKLVIRNQGGVEAGTVATPVVVPVHQPVTAIAPPPVITASAPPPAQKGNEQPVASGNSDEARYVPIKSPMVGTFYRSTAPDKPALVKVGDVVEIGTRVCVIEAMKLFNEIESDVKGKIVKILPEDASPVEYDQPLFLVDPS